MVNQMKNGAQRFTAWWLTALRLKNVGQRVTVGMIFHIPNWMEKSEKVMFQATNQYGFLWMISLCWDDAIPNDIPKICKAKTWPPSHQAVASLRTLKDPWKTATQLDLRWSKVVPQNAKLVKHNSTILQLKGLC